VKSLASSVGTRQMTHNRHTHLTTQYHAWQNKFATQYQAWQTQLNDYSDMRRKGREKIDRRTVLGSHFPAQTSPRIVSPGN